VLLELPRFKVEYGVKSLKKELIAMGMQDAFEPTAEFQRMTGTRNPKPEI
jgi:serine protease inhibitor